MKRTKSRFLGLSGFSEIVAVAATCGACLGVPLVVSAADCVEQTRLSETTRYMSAHVGLLNLYGPTYKRVIQQLNGAFGRLSESESRVLTKYGLLETQRLGVKWQGNDEDYGAAKKALIRLKPKWDAILKKVQKPFTRNPKNPHSDVSWVLYSDRRPERDEMVLVSCIANYDVDFDTKQISSSDKSTKGFYVCMEGDIRTRSLVSWNPVNDILNCRGSRGGRLFRDVNLCMQVDHWVAQQVEKSCPVTPSLGQPKESETQTKDLDHFPVIEAASLGSDDTSDAKIVR